MRTAAFLLLLGLAASAKEDAAEAGWLGVVPTELGDEARERFRIPPETKSGVVLSEILPGSAAEAAGMRAGDVLHYFDRKEVKTPDELREMVRAHRAGDVVTYALRRGTETVEGTLTLGRAADLEEETFVDQSDEARVSELERQLAELRLRVEKRRAEVARRMDPLVPWIEREERLLGEAKKSGDSGKAARHEARLELLREMRKEGFETPFHAPGPGGRILGPDGSLVERAVVHLGRVERIEERLDRLEKKVDSIIEMLSRRAMAEQQSPAK